MIGTIALFELRKRLTQISTYVYLTLFFALGVLFIFAVGGAFSSVSAGAGSEKILANAPLTIDRLLASITNLGVMMSAAIFGQAVHQDIEARTDALLFTFPIRKSHYLAGRFLGAFLFVLVVFLGVGLGMFVGAHFPFLIDHALFGPTPITAYLWPYVVSVIPNLLFTGALFFALGTLTRKMMPVYLAMLAVVVGYLVAGMLLSDVENLTAAALLDPFGGAALRALTRYWTVAEQNHNFIPLSGLLLANRALYSCLGLAALGLTFARFRMAHVGTAERPAAASGGEKLDATGPIPLVPVERSGLRALVTLTRLAFVETIKNTYFAVLVVAALAVALTAMSLAGKISGTATWPVTGLIASIGEGSFGLFMLIIITFYAGELVWRERDLNLAQITDALPLPTWASYLSKLLALCLLPFLLLFAVLISGVIFQTVQGYHHYEIGLYLKQLYVFALPGYLFLCVLAFFVQALLQNKYLGHFAMVLYYLASPFLDRIGLEHGLFKYGEVPNVTHSDMNGFGHFLKPVLIYDLYWSGFAILLAVGAALFWSRGLEAPFKERAALAAARFTTLPRMGAALGLLIALGAGGTIYYNEDILNRFVTAHGREEEQADYEKKYKALQSAPQPRITGVSVDYDLYPAEERLDAHGIYQLENKSGAPISNVYVELGDDQRFEKMSIGDAAAPSESDPRLGFYSYRLKAPLLPGAKTTLEFNIQFGSHGFRAGGNRTDLAANGTFFNSFNLPHLGYNPQGELAQDNDRKKYGLAPKERLPDLHDAKGLANNLISNDADWIDFEANVSTSADQLAVMPGTLVKEWTENGRRHFHYKAESPILDFFAVNSARYAVRKESWNDVALEIDYHPTHTFDLDEMFQGMKDSLSYCSKSFGPFQFHQLRIVEFPRYQSFAQSFPNTIPYSESVGFILRVDPNPLSDVIDFPYYVTAHEVAHQWWAHQLIGGDVQGVTLLDETLAQYSALMVMKARFGAPQMRRFLKYELDQYLRGRAFEQKKEVPLLRVESQQYIHYNKGSLVMYALQDAIGEDAVDRALKALLERYRFKGPPYPSAQALLDELTLVTPAEQRYLLHDLFETITLYDNRALSATARLRAGGKYEVTLQATVKKMQASEQGEEKEVPVDDFIDVGALDKNGDPIALERRKLQSGAATLTLMLDKLPAKAGIDPLHKLIDRHPDDNVVPVTLEP